MSTPTPKAPSPLRPLPALIFASRWLQLPLYLGLIAAQAVYVWHFLLELSHLVEAVFGNQAALKALLSPDETLEVVTLDPAGAASVSGEVKGYKAPVYAVPVAAGQTLVVAFKSANTSLYMNVTDAADASGAAVHRGEVDGPNATLTAVKDTTYLLQPFMVRAAARRGESGPFEITVTRK